MNNEKLLGKLMIKGKIRALTGLHIGGSSTSLEIGGIDANVIKKANGEPYIPGSSLKGKLRSLLEKSMFELNYEYFDKNGKLKENLQDENAKIIYKLFGRGAENSKEHNRLIVRDSNLILKSMFSDPDNLVHNKTFKELELTYTEGKWENTINRIDSSANPRQIERVPAGTQFNFEIVFNIYDKKNDKLLVENLKKAMRLVEDDYLGGSGTRGYGKIKFKNIKYAVKTIDYYEKDGIVIEYKKTESIDEIKLEE